MTRRIRHFAPQSAATDKGGRTQGRILAAAAQLFAERGYDGASIREVEAAARVNRGVVTYHFGNKKELWKAAFGFTFSPYLEELRSKAELLRALDPEARALFLIAGFVRTSAERPHMNRMMIQENFSASWRSKWIAEKLLAPARELYREINEGDPVLQLFDGDPHLRYALLGACNMVFSHPYEVKSLYQLDVYDAAFVDRHVATVVELFRSWLTTSAATKENRHV